MGDFLARFLTPASIVVLDKAWNLTDKIKTKQHTIINSISEIVVASPLFFETQLSPSQLTIILFHIVKLQSSLTVQSKSVGLGVDTKMTVQTPPQKLNGEHQETQINIY